MQLWIPVAGSLVAIGVTTWNYRREIKYRIVSKLVSVALEQISVDLKNEDLTCEVYDNYVKVPYVDRGSTYKLITKYDPSIVRKTRKYRVIAHYLCSTKDDSYYNEDFTQQPGMSYNITGNDIKASKILIHNTRDDSVIEYPLDKKIVLPPTED